MSIEKIIHRKAESYVEALQTDDDRDTRDASPIPLPVGRPPKNGETATAHIHIRTTLARKIVWVKAAKGKPLAEMVTEIVDKAVNYEL